MAEEMALDLMDLMSDTLTAALLLREGTEDYNAGSLRQMLVAGRY